MSDLAATNCGCGGSTPSCGSNNCLLIILLLFCCGGGDTCGSGTGRFGGLFGGGGCGGCGNDSCDIIIWILLISCLCGGC